MEFIQMYICVVLLVQIEFIRTLTEKLDDAWHSTISNQTVATYNIGVSKGIINPEKYSLKSFAQDEHSFKNIYEEFISSVDIKPMKTYQQWLELNNYGLMADTKKSIFQNKASTRSSKSKKLFKRLLETGDILISSRSDSGLLGHAAIMVSDYWVLEMEGGRKWKKGIKDNNRQISKGDWYDENCDEEITIYRCYDSTVAENAAYWADTHYYDPYGGLKKTIHITYKITADSFDRINPSYSSKLVLQAFYYSTRGVIINVEKYGPVIVPINIPAYFKWPYNLEIIERF